MAAHMHLAYAASFIAGSPAPKLQVDFVAATTTLQYISFMKRSETVGALQARCICIFRPDSEPGCPRHAMKALIPVRLASP